MPDQPIILTELLTLHSSPVITFSNSWKFQRVNPPRNIFSIVFLFFITNIYRHRITGPEADRLRKWCKVNMIRLVRRTETLSGSLLVRYLLKCWNSLIAMTCVSLRRLFYVDLHQLCHNYQSFQIISISLIHHQGPDGTR